MPLASLPATIVATLLSFALGALWYGPLFSKPWMAAHGFTQEVLAKDFNPGIAYGTTFVLAFVGAYMFGMFLGPHPSITLGVGAGAAAGLFWVTGSIATNDVFERRSIRLTLINGGYHTVRFVLIGLAFALLG